jgi:hypothetical protein
MSTEDGKDRKSPRREHGPQGTHVFSRSDVDRLIEEAGSTAAPASQAQLKGVSVEVKGRNFPLTGSRCTIGRDSSCDIVLSDSSVSSEHARLSHDDGGWRVANLLSTNGTFVNDKRISNESVKNGDRVRLGRVEFIFQDSDKPQSHSEPGAQDSGLKRWLPWVAGAIVVIVIVLVVLL